MPAKESAGPSFELPEEVLAALPTDPFEQLDVARKITSIALSTRVSALESEASVLRAQLTDRDAIIADLQAHMGSIEVALSDAAANLAKADQEKESLLKENDMLSNTVKKLNRDVSKLEGFKKALMQSLQEDEETPGGTPKVAATIQANLPSQSLGEEDDGTLPPSRTSSVQSQFSEIGSSNVEEHDADASKPPRVYQNLLASQTSTPRFTPLGSPAVLSASASPTRKSKSASPRRHSVSFATTRGMLDSSSPYGSMSGYDAGSQAGRTRVEGKEFFRQVRSRLSYEQFASFLANVKELNSHKLTKEETLQKAEEIFGPDNKDLYTIFEGLITRNVR